jgi:hypothetical protein
MGAGRLTARWVVHGAVMGHDLQTNAEVTRGFEPRSLERVAFAVFGAGARRAFEAALAA